MAPPTVLAKIVNDFDFVDVNVVSEKGRRVRMRDCAGIVVCVGKRWRPLDPEVARSPGGEERRLSRFLCCPEKLKFVGTVCPVWITAVGAFSGREKLRLPEIYVGESSRLFVYSRTELGEGLALMAENIDELVALGTQALRDLAKPDPWEMPRDPDATIMGTCSGFVDLLRWRNACIGRTVTLVDGVRFRVCDMFYACRDPEALDAWSSQACVTQMEVFGVVERGPEGQRAVDRPVLLTDSCGKIYVATKPPDICIVAGSPREFAFLGLLQQRQCSTFYGDERVRRFSNSPACPNALCSFGEMRCLLFAD